MPVTPAAEGELARLREAVLARGGVEHQQHVVRRAGNELGGGALHLFQLGHQIRLVVQAPGGVHDHGVGSAPRAHAAVKPS